MPRKKNIERRGHGQGSGGWRKDGRYAWRITLPDGKRRSFYGTTEAKAKEKAERVLADLATGLDPADANLLLSAFLATWLEDVAANRVRTSTLRSYRGHIDRHIVPAIGTVEIRDLTPQHVNRMLAAIAKDGHAATANRVRATLRTALSTAVSWGLVTRNVAALADPRRHQVQRVTPLSHDQILKLIDATHDHRYGSLIAVAVTTGLRQGELLALRWTPDIDLPAGTLTVHHTLVTHQGKVSANESDAERKTRLQRQRNDRLGPPKTEQSQRTIRLSRLALAALERQRIRVGESRMKAAGRWQELDLVFPTSIGTFADGPTITRELQRILVSIGLPRQRFHDLRHATASLQLGEGAELFAVKELLGHSQIALTANTYGHMTRRLSNETAERMDRALLFDTNGDTKTAAIGRPSAAKESG